jgi:hypothetical protein
LVAVFVLNSLIIENGGGPPTGGGGNILGSVAELVVTDTKRGKATVKKFCIKFNRTLHPNRKGVYQPSREALSWALIHYQGLIIKIIMSDYLVVPKFSHNVI